ncbi:unnamed protein product [Urochloa humidicola]
MRLSLPPTQVLEVDIQRVMKGGALRVAGCVEGEISVGRLALLRVLREQVYLNDWLEFSHFSQAFICARVKNVHFMNCFFRFQLVGREEIFLALGIDGLTFSATSVDDLRSDFSGFLLETRMEHLAGCRLVI